VNSEKKTLLPRNRRIATWLLGAVMIALAAVIVLNVVLSALPLDATRYNLASSNEFELSAKSKKWLTNLNTNVTLYLVCLGGEPAADHDLHGFLEQYANASEKIELQVVDPRVDEGLIMPFGGVWPSDNSVIVSSEKRYRIIENADLYAYYNKLTQTQLSGEEYDLILEELSKTDETGDVLLSFAEQTEAQFDGESRVTNAINFVSLENVAHLYLLTGNGTASLPASLQKLLSQSAFEIHSLGSLSEIPANCNLLVMHAPSVDLSDPERNALEAYLAGGGKLFLTTFFSKNDLPNLAAVLQTYGMAVQGNQGDYVCDGNPNNYLAGQNESHALFRTEIQSTHPATGEFLDSFVVWQAHGISLTPTQGVYHAPWLTTSDSGYLREYKINPDNHQGYYTDSPVKQAYTVCAIAEKESNNSCVIWLSSPQALESTYNTLSENSGNYTLAVRVLNYATGTGADSVAIPSVAISQSVITVNATQFTVTAICLIAVIPFGIAIFGISSWISRKKR